MNPDSGKDRWILRRDLYAILTGFDADAGRKHAPYARVQSTRDHCRAIGVELFRIQMAVRIGEHGWAPGKRRRNQAG